MRVSAMFQSLRHPAEVWVLSFLSLWLGWAPSVRAEFQFDVFVGYGLGANEGVVAEGRWFPVVFEIANDGPAFDGIIELGGQSSQRHRVTVELPTGTRKRVLVPCYSSGRSLLLEARLLDARGKVHAVRPQLRPRQFTDRESPLIGSLSRTLSGSPFLPEVQRRNNQLQPAVARLSLELFPDNVIALDGLSSLYLHSSRAGELKAPQVNALLAWLHGGGHLILGVESPSDINATAWLSGLLPCEVTGFAPRSGQGALQSWLKELAGADSGPAAPGSPGRRPRGASSTSGETSNPFTRLETDRTFENAPLPVAAATLRDGRVLIGTGEAPLVLQCARGRGTLTVLLFSPELEPFKSWKNRAWFWARICDVPLEWLAGWSYSRAGGTHVDGIFGAMTDSRQIRKLPVTWLFVLLLAYLAVIGPVDQFVLKKLNKQMLTWVTFPLYVVFFSLLIYYIGYRLRAGEAEWNEFHVVDVIPHGERADLRGRTYGSLYSPVNAQYPVACAAPCAALRGEIRNVGGQEISKAAIEQQGNSIRAGLTVPIWTSQLYLADWWRQGPAPVRLAVRDTGNGPIQVTVENLTQFKIPRASLVRGRRVYDLGELPRAKTWTIPRETGRALSEFVVTQRNIFTPAAEARRSQWGRSQPAVITDYFAAAVAASFLGEQNPTPQPGAPYRPPYAIEPGFDLGPSDDRGDAILLAWMPEASLLAPMNQFSPRRSHKWTLLRVIAPAQSVLPVKPEA